jgi:hypothetical protein
MVATLAAAGQRRVAVPEANIGVLTGTPSGVVVTDVDGAEGEQSLDDLGLANVESLVSHTGRGRHLFFSHPGGTVRSRVKVAPGLDVRGDGGYVVAPPSLHASGAKYAWANAETDAPWERNLSTLPMPLLSLLTNGHEGTDAHTLPVALATHQATLDLVATKERIPEGHRNATLTRHAGRLFARGLSPDEVLPVLLDENGRCCTPPLEREEVARIVRSIGSTHAVSVANRDAELDATTPVVSWPAPPDEAAFHGIAGELVQAIAPHTEAAPVGILTCLLVGIGNAIGRTTLVRIDGRPQALNLFAVLTGPTSTGRKGTAWACAEEVLRVADPAWVASCSATGLSTGEGLLHRVRDGVEADDETPTNVGPANGRSRHGPDRGVSDKRLFVVEEEFAQALRAMQREGNTLSAVLRMVWDGKSLGTLTRHSASKATDPHISVLAQITPEELRRLLNRTELVNGLVNRFLIVCVRRDRLLPNGGNPDPDRLAPLLARLQDSLVFGRQQNRLARDPAADRQWESVYERLTEGPPGVMGELTARAAPLVMRLAGVYAVLDRASVVRPEHLAAALAIWDYAERSAGYIFSGLSGDPVRDRLLEGLRRNPNGMTRTEIRDFFSRSRPEAEITRALQALSDAGLVRSEKLATAGRPAHRWYAIVKSVAINPTEPTLVPARSLQGEVLQLRSDRSVSSPDPSHDRDALEERAALMHYDGGLPLDEADRHAHGRHYVGDEAA